MIMSQQETKRDIGYVKPEKIKIKPHFGRLGPSPSILSREQRLNPFYEAPMVGDNEFKHGLENLLARGVIPKDFDLTPAFEKGLPPIQRHQSNLHPFSQKFQTKPINEQSNQNKVNIDYQNAGTFLTEQTGINNLKYNIKVSKPPSANSNENFQMRLTQVQSERIQTTMPKEEQLTHIEQQLLKYNKTIQKEIINVNSYPLKLSVQCFHIDHDTSTFKQFKQMFYNNWKIILVLIKRIQVILQEYGFQKTNINGHQLGALSSFQYIITDKQLISCLDSQELILQIMDNPKKSFNVQKKAGELRAIICIQKNYRYLKQIIEFKLIKKHQESATKLQIFIKLQGYLNQMRKMKQKRIEKKMNKVKKYNQKLKNDWGHIQNQPRIEIHIDGMSYSQFQRHSTEKLEIKKNMQISRLFLIKDPNLELIIVIPKQFSQELINYYFTILELGKVLNFKERVHFIWPQLPSHMHYLSLIDQLYYDSVALQKIKKLIAQKITYLVPGHPCFTQIHLAHCLRIPIFSGNPQNSYQCSLKSGARQIFQEIGLPMAPGSDIIKDEKQLYDCLALLLFQNQSVQFWRLKVIDEFQGRGQAIFHFETAQYLQDMAVQTLSQESVLQVIKDQIIRVFFLRLNVQCPTLFRSTKEFMQHFFERGGIIEAQAPSGGTQCVQVSFLIKPDGSHELLGSFDKVSTSSTSNRMGLYQQSQITGLNYQGLVEMLASCLYQKDIMGYISIDLVMFTQEDVLNQLRQPSSQPSSSAPDQYFYAIDLDCYCNNFTANIFYFDFLMNGLTNQQDSSYSITLNTQQNSRVFMILPFIFHTALVHFTFAQFFQDCRQRHIQFDFKVKLGTTFSILDEFSQSVMGVMTVAQDHRSCVTQMLNLLEYLNQFEGKSTTSFNEVALDRYDQQTFQEALQTVRIWDKKYLYSLESFA